MTKRWRMLGMLSGAKVRSRPDWSMPRNATDRKKREWRMHMIAWTCDRLNEKFGEQVENRVTRAFADDEAFAKAIAARTDWSATDELALAAARRDDIVPLLARLPNLAKFLKKKPKGGRGKYPRRKKVDVHETARWAANCIRREIWPEHFGRKNRPNNDPLSAENIAAAWLDADRDDIHWKAPGKHKAPRRKSPRQLNFSAR